MDKLQKYISADQSVVFGFLDATQTVNESLKRVGCLPPAGIHLGQALMGCVLVRSLYGEKSKNKLRMQWSVDGGFGNLFVDTDERGAVRGTIAKPQHFAGQLKESLGQGVLQVIREEKKSHTGLVESKGSVCPDILEYLHQSEQRRCAMNLWVQYDSSSDQLQIKNAWAYVFEILPIDDALKKEMIATFWEEKFRELGNMSTWKIDPKKPLESMADITLGSFGNQTQEQKIFFECTCSKERAERALVFANDKDKDNHQDAAEITCEYCGQRYDINLKDPS